MRPIKPDHKGHVGHYPRLKQTDHQTRMTLVVEEG